MQRDEAELLGGPEDHLLATAATGRRRSCASTHANSATTSREAVPSIELCDAPVEAQLRGHGLRVQAQRGAGQGARAVRARPPAALSQSASRSHVAQQRPGVGQQVVAKQHRLGVLQVGAAGHGHPRVRSACSTSASIDVEHAAADDPGVRRAGTSASAWRSGRCATGRRGACRRARRRRRSISPRSSAPCTSSSDSAGRKSPEATSASQLVQGVEHARQLGVGRAVRPGAARGRAPGTRRCRSGPAASRSASTCSARPAPPPGRRRTGRPTDARVVPRLRPLSYRVYSPATRTSRPEASLADMPVDLDEARGPGTGRRCRRVVGGEVEVVQADVASAGR